MTTGRARNSDLDEVFQEFAATCGQSRRLMEAARERTQALGSQIAHARRHLSTSRTLLQRATSMADWWNYGDAVSAPMASATPVCEGDAPVRTFSAVTELIEQIEQAATRDVDLAGELMAIIKRAIQNETDPSLLMGILLEGIVQTVLGRLAMEERRDTVMALCALLVDRINQRGAVLD